MKHCQPHLGCLITWLAKRQLQWAGCIFQGARQQDFISGAPEIMSSVGLKCYPLCGFDCGQVLNKTHVRKHGFCKADNLGFEEQGTKDPRTMCWLGYLCSPCFLSCPFLFWGGGVFFGAGGGCLSLIQVHLFNPIWTLILLLLSGRLPGSTKPPNTDITPPQKETQLRIGTPPQKKQKMFSLWCPFKTTTKRYPQKNTPMQRYFKDRNSQESPV